MTLTEFKRTLKAGQTLTMTECSFDNRLVSIPRKVVQVNSVGFSLLTQKPDGTTRPSYMNWPKASGFRMLTPASFVFSFTYDTPSGILDKKTDSFTYSIS